VKDKFGGMLHGLNCAVRLSGISLAQPMQTLHLAIKRLSTSDGPRFDWTCAENAPVITCHLGGSCASELPKKQGNPGCCTSGGNFLEDGAAIRAFVTLTFHTEFRYSSLMMPSKCNPAPNRSHQALRKRGTPQQSFASDRFVSSADT
jgi:hypothetical protein